MVSTRNKLKLQAADEKSENFGNGDWKTGTIVWAQFSKKFWPAMVIDHQDIYFKAPRPNKVWVFWFGDYRISEVERKCIKPINIAFEKMFNENADRKSTIWNRGTLEAIREFAFPDKSFLTEPQLIEWAYEGFVGRESATHYITPFVNEKLIKLRNKNKKVDANLEQKILATSSQKAFIKDIVNGYQSLSSICLACYSTDIVDDHPIFNGCVCADCKVKLKNTFYVIGDDGIKYFCVICARPGNMLVCEDESCGRAYCMKCIDDLASPGAKDIIKNTEIWYCFTCMPTTNLSGLLEVRPDWHERVQRLFVNLNSPLVLPPEIIDQKQPIRVLSLFDGIGTGFVALDKLNVVVERYFSCEIDEDSIKVVRRNFPNRVIYLGDILNLTESDVQKITPIDLLIGGSPCNDLSLANPNRKGLFDPAGSGVLFFEFYRILTTLRIHNGKPFFWLYENVASMPLQWKVAISRYFQCECTMIDSAWVSPQHRRRLYWGNLPTLQGQIYEDDGPELQQYLKPGRTATVNKLRTVTTRQNSLKQGPSMQFPVMNSAEIEDELSILELEKVFGYPPNYTKVGVLTGAQRQMLLGKAWSVQVICLLFRVLQEHFQTK